MGLLEFLLRCVTGIFLYQRTHLQLMTMEVYHKVQIKILLISMVFM